MVDMKTIHGMNETQYIIYGRATISIGVDGSIYVDYPNEPEIMEKFSHGIYHSSHWELVSDRKRYRAYYRNGDLKGAIADAEAIL